MLGLLVAIAAMTAAWQHNAQGEIHDASGIDWGYWFLIGLSWFVPVGLMGALTSGGIIAIAGYLCRRDAT